MLARIFTAIESKRRSGSPVLCNLGCGARIHPGWINIDFNGDGDEVLAWNLRNGLPLADNSCDAIYASHVIEHFNRADAKLFLLDCRRALKRGGVLRLVAPNLEDIARTYLSCLEAARRGEPNASDKYEWIVMELLDQLVRHRSGGDVLKYWSRSEVPAEEFVVSRVGTEYLRARKSCKGKAIEDSPIEAEAVGAFRLGGEVHQWMYDDYSLGKLIESCGGFEEIARCRADESRIANFAGFHLDTEPDGSVYKPDSFFIEAVRRVRRV
jgi:predicted SAM-dependent methyltransferase